MKKKTLLTWLFAIGLMITGCVKPTGCNPEEYNGSGSNPCLPQIPCSDYPNEGVVISWDDYNTCAALNNYFRCHRKALEEHEGDTLRLAGWLDMNEPYYTTYETLDYQITWAVLTDDESHHPEVYDGILLNSYEIIDFSCFTEKRLYITGVLHMFDTYTGDCCAVSPKLDIVTIDTLNNRE